MTSGQDVSEFLDTLGLVKSYFSSFLEKKKSIFFLWCSDAPEDQSICLFEGLLANPDMSLSRNLVIMTKRRCFGETIGHRPTPF